MAEQFMLLAAKGAHPPKYVHLDIALAVQEAQRLSTMLNCKVLILKIIGECEIVEVPVVKKSTVVTLNPEYKQDDLPF